MMESLCMAEGDSGLGIGEDAVGIGPAMGELRRHGAGERFELLAPGAALEVEKARDATHS